MVVEFGKRPGVSSVALLAGQPLRLVSVEPALEECTDAISAAAGRTDVEFLLGSSLTSDIPECDLLFIDSRHTADQLWQELTLHCDEVRRWIGLHDTETFGATGEDGGPGLLAALERFLRRHPEWAPVFHSTRNHGFTVLGRNRASPPPLATSDPIPDCLLRELAGFPRPCPPVYSGPSRIDCYLTTYEQLTWPRAMASQCERLGLNPILLDNGSTYEPLLKWLETCPYPVIRVGNNAGCYGFWRARRHHFLTSPYIVSDSDLDLSGVPIDVVDRLRRALDENPDVAKAGLSLEIDDIPEHYAFKHDVVGWERQYWQVHRGEHWQAGIGATFALYDPERNAMLDANFYPALRLDRPYTARHLPWYLNLSELSGEMQYYYSRCDDLAHWGSKMKRHLQGANQ